VLPHGQKGRGQRNERRQVLTIPFQGTLLMIEKPPIRPYLLRVIPPPIELPWGQSF
jgi:hypothetical protein